MGNVREILNKPGLDMGPLPGPPNIVETAGFKPESAGYTVMGNVREILNKPGLDMRPLPGPPNIVETASFKPESAGYTVMGNVREISNKPGMDMGPLPGPPNIVETAGFKPESAGKAALQAGAHLSSGVAHPESRVGNHQPKTTDSAYLQAMRIVNIFNQPTYEPALRARA